VGKGCKGTLAKTLRQTISWLLAKIGYLIDHTATIYLITPDGKIKLLYTSAKQDPKKMAEDIQYLLKNF
jgi:cytochrome oxidase Cu insertion factor (SCO1/SenC/PrrC family)